MNDIEALRGHLFNTLTALQDPDKPMDIQRAKLVCEVGSVIIDTAKAEIDFLRVNGSIDTNFFHKPGVAQIGNGRTPMIENKDGATTIEGHVTTHRLKG